LWKEVAENEKAIIASNVEKKELDIASFKTEPAKPEPV